MLFGRRTVPAVIAALKTERKRAAVVIDPLNDACSLFAKLRSWLVVIAIRDGGNRTRQNGCFPGRLCNAVNKGKGLPEYHGVLVCRIGVAAEAEIAKTVDDVTSLVPFDGLQAVRVMSDDDVRAGVNGGMGDGFLRLVDEGASLRSPVKGEEDQGGTVFLRFCNGGLCEPNGSVQTKRKIINGNHGNRNSFDGSITDIGILCVQNVRILKIFDSIGIAFFPVVAAVVVSEGYGLDGAGGQDVHIGGRTPESKLLVLSCAAVRQSSLQIHQRDVILLKIRKHIGKEVAIISYLFIDGKKVSCGILVDDVTA